MRQLLSNCDKLLSNYAFHLNLRPYSEAATAYLEVAPSAEQAEATERIRGTENALAGVHQAGGVLRTCTPACL